MRMTTKKEIKEESQRKLVSDITKSVKEFQETGLLWWTNTLLHVFGWNLAILRDEESGKILGFAPMRTSFRGFTEEANTKGYIKVSQYMKDTAEVLLEEASM